MRTLNHVFAACSKRFGGAFVDLHIESARRGFARYARSVRNKTGAAAPLLAGSSKKQTTPLLRLASRRSSARRWPDDFRRPAPVLGRSMTGRNVASESQALGKSVPRRRRRLGSTGATAASPATLSAPRMAPGAVRDNTQHARHAAAAPTDWRAHPRASGDELDTFCRRADSNSNVTRWRGAACCGRRRKASRRGRDRVRGYRRR